MSEQCGQALAVEHDGGVNSCDHFVDTSHYLGNVRTNALAQLFDSAAQNIFGDAKHNTLPMCCTTCDVISYCQGGCPKDRFAVSKSGEPGLNYLCDGYRALYEHVAPYVDRMTALIKVGRPPSTIMEEIERVEHDERQTFRVAGRNDPCPCGSERKFK